MDLCLVGKLISDKPFNKVGIRVAIFQAWHFIKNLEMEEVEGDRFIFSFPSMSCRQRVLEQAPWSFKGFPLLLKPLSPGETVHEVDLASFPVWVQVHGLPMGQSTKLMEETAARRAGKVVEVDFRSNKEVWVTQFIRVKVLIQVSQPLVSGFFFPRLHREDTWVQFKYEKLTGFCYNCG